MGPNREDHWHVSMHLDKIMRKRKSKWTLGVMASSLNYFGPHHWFWTPEKGVDYWIARRTKDGKTYSYVLYCNGAHLGVNDSLEAVQQQAAEHWSQFTEME